MNERRAKVSTVQSRLAVIQDRQRRKLIGNQLSLISTASDCIRIRTRKTYEDDVTSMICEKADVISVVFPPIADVPFRKIKVDEVTHRWQLTSLVDAFADDAQQKLFSCEVPWSFDVDVGDLIFRIFVDDDNRYPSILCLQVTELLGTMGGARMIRQKMLCTIPTIQLPQEILDVIQLMAERRLRLGW